MIRVLFVCLGNICRSPMAEAVFRDLVEKKGVANRFEIDSAGTSDWHVGKRPHEGTLNKLAQYHVGTEGMYARQLRKDDRDTFDYIVAMDSSNEQNIQERFGGSADHVFRLLDLVDGSLKDVPDPYYTGDFQETYDLVTEATQRLYEKIEREHGPFER